MRPRTIFCDIDGTLIRHDSPEIAFRSDYKMVPLTGTLQKLLEWDRLGYNIILTTGRRESMREITEKQLAEVGIFYDQLIMGIGGGERYLINDTKPDGTVTATAINLSRNAGIYTMEANNKSCVVFSVSIFNSDKLFVLREFLDTFKLKFSECDYYIGINYGSIPEVEAVISEYGLNTVVRRLQDESLYCGSDASAYQVALTLLKASNRQYNVCWFAHTKGAVNGRPTERSMYLSELFGDRVRIEQLFKSYDKLGSYALRGVSSGAAGDNWKVFNNDHHIGICSNEIYAELKYTHINWSYIETMYAIKGEAVEAFLQNTPDEFYTEKLKDPCYFEIIFPWIASRCGYFPYIKNSRCFWGSIDLKDITKQWIEENNLEHLNNYLTL